MRLFLRSGINFLMIRNYSYMFKSLAELTLEKCNSSWGKLSDYSYISEFQEELIVQKLHLQLPFFNPSWLYIVINSVRTAVFHEGGAHLGRFVPAQGSQKRAYRGPNNVRSERVRTENHPLMRWGHSWRKCKWKFSFATRLYRHGQAN